METNNIRIKILEVTEKVSKNGAKYLTIKTSGGSFSCWIEGLFGILRAVKANGEEIGVTVQKKGAFSNIIGAEGIEAVNASARLGRSEAIKEAMERKEAGIKTFTEKKENSMREFAAKRDAAMFAVLTWEGEDGDKKVDMLKKAHAYWLKFFLEEVY